MRRVIAFVALSFCLSMIGCSKRCYTELEDGGAKHGGQTFWLNKKDKTVCAVVLGSAASGYEIDLRADKYTGILITSDYEYAQSMAEAHCPSK